MRGPQDCAAAVLAPGLQYSPQPKRPLLHGLLNQMYLLSSPHPYYKGETWGKEKGRPHLRQSAAARAAGPSQAGTWWLLSEALVGLPSPYQPQDRGCSMSQTEPSLCPQNQGLGMCFLPRYGGGEPAPISESLRKPLIWALEERGWDILVLG